MPHIVKILEKTIKLTSANKIILAELQKVLTSSSFKWDESHQTGLATSEAKNLSGWWMSLLRGVGKDGTSTSNFKDREVLLDPPAYALRMYYVSLWNLQCRKKGDKIAIVMEQPTIEDTDLLVREILVRFFTIALSTEMNVRTDGEELVRIIENFLERVRTHTDILSPSLKDFLLTAEHLNWIKCLNEMVTKLKELHANTRVITQILRYLTQNKYTIARQLIAELDQNRAKEEFADGQVELTLHDCESKVLGASVSGPGAPSTTVILTSVIEGFNAITLSSRQKQVVLQLSSTPARSDLNNTRLKKEHVEDLYFHLHRTNILLEVFQQLDLLCLTLSWLPFSLGMVNMQGLDHLLTEYKEYIKMLELDKTKAPALKKNNIRDAFFQYNATGQHDKISIKVSEDFRKLFDRDLQQNIAKLIYSSVERLCLMQNLLGVTLVNLDMLHGTKEPERLAPSPSASPSSSPSTLPSIPANKPAAANPVFDMFAELRALNQHPPSNKPAALSPPASPAVGKHL